MSADLDAFRREIELHILDEAKRRGITRVALHVDVSPLDPGDGLDVIAMVLTLDHEDRENIRKAIDAKNAERKVKN